MVRRIFLFVLSFSLYGSAQAKHPFTFEDMMQLKRVGEPVVSPDSRWAAFSAVDVNLEENTKTPHLWIVSLGGGEAKRLTPSNGRGEDGMQFAPDAKHILFASSKDGSSQVWVQDFDSATGTLTGDPRKVTNISTEASDAIWSPDGKSILFVSAVWPDCKDDACNKQRDEEVSKSKVKAKTSTHLMFRHWNAYASGKRNHLFVLTTEADCIAPESEGVQRPIPPPPPLLLLLLRA